MADGERDGFLVVDKPAGWTSHDVVGRVRRLVGQRQVGHAGTLDPAATGVLPVAVGAATRVLEYLNDASKTYLAEITFGVETDSYDGDGRVIGLADPGGITAGTIEDGLAAQRGPQEQLPPMHSAIKVGGRRLYDAARRGEEVERPPRPVTIHVLELLDWVPPTATVLVDCSKGTYVRTIARDLGRAAGPGAYLSGLVRLRAGPFRLCQAWTLPELAEQDLRTAWPWVAIHPDVAVADWPAVILGEESATRWQRGSVVDIRGHDLAHGQRFRAYDAGGAWLGVGSGTEGDGWGQPLKVVPAATMDKGAR